MKRREFIKTGAATATVAGAAGAGAVLGSACGGLFEGNSFDVGRIPLPDMDTYLKKYDDGLVQIDDWNITDEVGDTGEDLSRENELAKQAFKSLFVTGMFGDLPDEGQVHPGMQARVARALPDMDEAVYGMIDYLQGISDEDVQAAQELLQGKSDPGMEFAEWLDGKAWSVDVTSKWRMKSRGMMAHATTRMRRQSPRLVFDEYIGKVEKVAAQAGSLEEIERQMIARVGEQAFWERQQRLAMCSAQWEAEGATRGGGQEPLPPVDVPDPEAFPAPAEADAGVPPAPTQPAPVPAPGGGEQKIVLTEKQLQEMVEERKRQAQKTSEEQRDRSKLSRDGLSASQRKKKLMRAGGWCLGIGLAVGVVAVVLVAVDSWLVGPGIAGLVLMTPAGILILIGLIMLIVVGIKYRNV